MNRFHRPRRLRDLLADRSGLSAIEFALILPFMVTLYLGGTELSHMMTVDRKVTSAASAVGDLVAQTAVVNRSEMDNIYDAAGTILNPYDPSALTMVVSSVEVTNRGDKVLWSDALHTAPRARNSTVALPEGVRIEGTTLILAEVEYTYTPTLGSSLTEPLLLRDTFYMRPRITDEVCWDRC